MKPSEMASNQILGGKNVKIVQYRKQRRSGRTAKLYAVCEFNLVREKLSY